MALIETPGRLWRDGPFDSLVLLLPDERAFSTGLLSDLPDVTPVVVVTPHPQETAIVLRRQRIFEFVPADALEHELSRTLTRAYASTTIGRADAFVRGINGVSSLLRAWLVRSLFADPPYSSVSAAAANSGSVRKEWQRKVGRSSPKAFLRWVILVRAAGLFEVKRTRSSVARALHISVGVLDRAAAHHLECELDPTSPALGSEIRRRFESYLIHTFVGAEE